jgi:hypothetical protein
VSRERKKKRSTLCAGVAAANSEAHADKLIFYALLLAIIKDLEA